MYVTFYDKEIGICHAALGIGVRAADPDKALQGGLGRRHVAALVVDRTILFFVYVLLTSRPSLSFSYTLP